MDSKELLAKGTAAVFKHQNASALEGAALRSSPFSMARPVGAVYGAWIITAGARAQAGR